MVTGGGKERQRSPSTHYSLRVENPLLLRTISSPTGSPVFAITDVSTTWQSPDAPPSLATTPPQRRDTTERMDRVAARIVLGGSV